MTLVVTTRIAIAFAVVLLIIIITIIGLINSKRTFEKAANEARSELREIEREIDSYKRDTEKEFSRYRREQETVFSIYKSKKEKEINNYKAIVESQQKTKQHVGELLFSLNRCKETIKEKDREINELNKIAKPKLELLKVAGSNLSAIPYMSKLIADYETIGIERIASALDWGHNVQRAQKVASIREIREYAKQIVEQNKYAQYQLAYLLELYPGLQDVIDSDYSELPMVELESLSERDPVRDYLSKEEYNSLSTTEKNQRALDKYVASHAKTKWQIGRDFELFVGHEFLERGWSVEFYGENMGLEDLGRDLIVKTLNGETYIVQCKYWSQDKIIHEKHITQLYGTTVSYCIEHGLTLDDVKGTLITNIKLSDMAKKMATYLDIEYLENHEIGDFPRIKCNNGVDEYGIHTKIYHLPFDQQYDTIKMKHKDDFWAYTVEEAERAGYRRAYKWFGKN